MTSNERREKIKEHIKNKGEVSLKELEESFGDFSTMTLRRDLIYLEENGFVKRTRGGAIALENLSFPLEDVYYKRALEHINEKKKIAKKAAKLISPGSSIYIDAGTSLMFLAKELKDDNYSVITDGVNIALELIKKSKLNVAIIGGMLNRNSISSSGIDALEMIRQVNIDVAFLGASGFSIETGFTNGIYDECRIKKEVIARARKKIILMDSSKVNKIMTFTFATVDDIDVLVSDDNLNKNVAKYLRDHNIVVL